MKAGRRRAFTLVEVLMAAALLTGVMVAGVSLCFQLSSLLMTQADDPVFDRHADRLESFLRAYRTPAASGTGTVPDDEPGLLPALRLDVPGDPPLLVGKPMPRTSSTLRLAFRRGSGLWLVWMANRDNRVGPGEPVRVLLSAQVADAQVLRFERAADAWSEERPDSPGLPDWRVLRLELRHAGRTRMLWIPWDTRVPAGGERR